jgi:hypothetical protein
VHIEEQSPDIGQGVHGMGTKTLEETGAQGSVVLNERYVCVWGGGGGNGGNCCHHGGKRGWHV